MRSYTFYCVLLICFAQVFSLEIPDDLFDKHTLECMEKLNIDKAIIQTMIGEDFHIVKGNPKINEQMECVSKSKNLVQEDGEINRDIIYNEVVNTLLPLMGKTKDKNEIANKIVDECIHLKNDNLGDRLIDMHNCFVNEANKY